MKAQGWDEYGLCPLSMAGWHVAFWDDSGQNGVCTDLFPSPTFPCKFIRKPMTLFSAMASKNDEGILAQETHSRVPGSGRDQMCNV